MTLPPFPDGAKHSLAISAEVNEALAQITVEFDRRRVLHETVELSEFQTTLHSVYERELTPSVYANNSYLTFDHMTYRHREGWAAPLDW